MIKKCNFKYDTWREILKPHRMNACKLSMGNECPGEKNCILFQIYKNIPHMMTKKEMMNYIPDGIGDINKC
jgi:hypothetical protein